MKNNLKNITLPIRERVITTYKKVPSFIEKHPFLAFFSVLGLLLALIIISSLFRKQAVKPQEPKPVVKSVKIYHIGTAPKIRVQAQVEKTGVITINSIASGVVQKLPFEPGDHVNRGSILAYLSTNYQGGNVAALQSKIAATQYQNLVDTLPAQKEIIGKQKERANKVDENADELRKITAQSLDETRNVMGLNDELLRILEENLKDLEALPDGTPLKESSIFSTKQLRAQYVGANNQLRDQLRNNEYSAADDKAPAQISNLEREIAVKQFEIQEKTLDLNAEISRLQLQVARVNEATMYPSAPFSGIVQRVLVKVGQAVNPGTPLAIIAQPPEEDPIVAIAYVPREVAQNISQLEASIIKMGDGQSFEAYPSYITQDAVQGTLYAIYYPVPDNYNKFVTEKGFVYIDLPMGLYDTGSAIPYIPIDAVYQTQEASYVYISKNGKAESRKVVLGQVYGSFVQVVSGLEKGSSVITDRNVVAGDLIKE